MFDRRASTSFVNSTKQIGTPSVVDEPLIEGTAEGFDASLHDVFEMTGILQDVRLELRSKGFHDNNTWAWSAPFVLFVQTTAANDSVVQAHAAARSLLLVLIPHLIMRTNRTNTAFTIQGLSMFISPAMTCVSLPLCSLD